MSSRKVKQAATELIPKGLRTPRTPGAQTPLPIEGEDADDAEKREKWRSRYKKDVEKEVERIRIKVGCIGLEVSTGLLIVGVTAGGKGQRSVIIMAYSSDRPYSG